LALRESKVVIPVLLAGVPRLAAGDLPPDLVRLSQLQSVAMDHRRVEVAIDELAERVAGMVTPPYDWPELDFRSAPPATARTSARDPQRPTPRAPRPGSPLVNNRRGRRR